MQAEDRQTLKILNVKTENLKVAFFWSLKTGNWARRFYFRRQKASGHDLISTRCIKENLLVIAPVLTQLIIWWSNNQNFQTVLKLREWLHVLKKDLKTNLANYWPISILSVISKIAEKLSWLNKRDYSILKFTIPFQLTKTVSSPGRSTSHAIQSFLEIIYKKLDTSEAAQTVFLDYSKAFDIWTTIFDLKYHHFSLESVNLLKSYLSYRKQFVIIKNFYLYILLVFSINVSQNRLYDSHRKSYSSHYLLKIPQENASLNPPSNIQSLHPQIQ